MLKGAIALVLVLSASICSCCGGSRTELPFSLFLSRSGPISYEGVLPAVELALSLVNNDSSLLPGFTLGYPPDAFVDAMCSATPSLQGFVRNLFEPPTKVFILGPDCSTPTLAVAELTQFWNLTQISFAATASALSNNENYPYFLRTVASDRSVSLGIVALMKEFNWDRIGIITQQEDTFTGTSRELETELEGESFIFQGNVIFSAGGSVQVAVDTVKTTGSRVIFLNVDSNQAAGLLCQAAAIGLTPPEYVWITYGWYFDNFWRSSTLARASNCTTEELDPILQGMLFVGHSSVEQDTQAPIIGNLTKQGFLEEYNRRHQMQFGSDGSLPEEAAAAYDAVWTAALALNATEEELAATASSLANFTYNDVNVTRLLHHNCLQVSFNGASGYVTFDANGDRLPYGHVQQYRRTADGSDLERVTFATFDGATLVFLDGEESATVFPGGPPPDKAFRLIPVPLFAVYTVLATVGVIFAIACMTFNVIFWKKAIISITQPGVNVIFCAGAALAYFLVILLGFDETFFSSVGATVTCNVVLWLGVVAFKLTFGALFAKALRIYYIFYNYRVHNKQKDIPSPFLVLIVACLLAVDLLFLLVVTAVPCARLERERILFSVQDNPDGTPPTFYYTCTAQSYPVWFTIFLVLSAVELMVGAFLAFETRKVNIKELSDSRLIALSIYSLCIVCVALTPIAYLLNEFVTEQYAIMGALLLASVTFILCVLFVPKMIGLYQDPTGEKDVALHGLQAVKSMEWGTTRGAGTVQTLEAERDTLKMEIKQLLQMPQVAQDQGNGDTDGDEETKM